MQLLRLPEASRELGVSYPTLKRWIYERKVSAVKTPGGHYRIPRSEVERLTHTRDSRSGHRPYRTDLSAISGRNKLLGVVTEVKSDGLLAQVTLDLGGQSVTSIITRAACRELGLKKGTEAVALIKATEVMLVRG